MEVHLKDLKVDIKHYQNKLTSKLDTVDDSMDDSIVVTFLDFKELFEETVKEEIKALLYCIAHRFNVQRALFNRFLSNKPLKGPLYDIRPKEFFYKIDLRQSSY